MQASGTFIVSRAVDAFRAGKPPSEHCVQVDNDDAAIIAMPEPFVVTANRADEGAIVKALAAR